MFKKILIANRGEIAVRIIKACKELGICSVAVYSDADKTSLHTRLADESYNIGPPPANESYLNKDKIINLALKIGAEAIHPGYGFFSENASFIKAVEESGLIFIGPSSKSVSLMGSKTSARKLMKQHNVPIVPGSLEPIIKIEDGLKTADEIEYPILLKASAGGGGKGMRRVNSKDEFQSAFESTKREALKAFANDEVYIEKFIEKPKHIEVQIIADKHGNYRHLFERECSIQRRHQKIIEESPSQFVDANTRDKITKAAIASAKACNYYNAGTIEFLMDADKNFYFLEMNTRVQVEHPVTELISGVDLVREQISIAAGNKISFEQNEIKLRGYALECRIYAEDAENNFFPSTGIIQQYKEPNGPGIRVDSGAAPGSQISIYYDPMIAKLICWDKDRGNAINRMRRALNEYFITGLITNISFLEYIISSDEFRQGLYDINYVDKLIKNNHFNKNRNKTNNEIIEAASIFAGLLKNMHSDLNHNNKNQNYSNAWRDQIYE